ncbi:hypothetical protein SEA_MORGANA_162 [Gordonia phage Morgana]|uniref:Uncharacterized protein n=1 Tax=Gordonia phage Morgana TaxID=3137292 RepID=A0AAX4RB10_9CAUD
MTDTITYLACGTCAVAVENGDDSGIAEADIAVVEASIEAAGRITYQGNRGSTGYFDCWFCEEVVMGDPAIFEGEDRG